MSRMYSEKSAYPNRNNSDYVELFAHKDVLTPKDYYLWVADIIQNNPDSYFEDLWFTTDETRFVIKGNWVEYEGYTGTVEDDVNPYHDSLTASIGGYIAACFLDANGLWDKFGHMDVFWVASKALGAPDMRGTYDTKVKAFCMGLLLTNYCDYCARRWPRPSTCELVRGKAMDVCKSMRWPYKYALPYTKARGANDKVVMANTVADMLRELASGKTWKFLCSDWCGYGRDHGENYCCYWGPHPEVI
jgi:hypothetical protein